MDRRNFIKGSMAMGIGLATGCTSKRQCASKARTNRRPNVLWIMLDDCRADALGCYGKAWARTPHMDRIAKRGIRFDKAIVQNPVCIPSRASMKTSQYPHDLGIMAMGQPPDVPPAEVVDKPRLLSAWKNAGIGPVNVGKSHIYQSDWINKGTVIPLLGHTGEPLPNRAPTAKIRAKLQEMVRSDWQPPAKTKTHGWCIGGVVPLEPQEMSTWRLGDRAVQTLKELVTTADPFFLRVSFHAPHVPFRVPQSYLIDPAKIDLPLPTEKELSNKPRYERENLRIYAGAPDLTNEQIGIARGTYYGMVSLVDTQVGRLMEVLADNKLLDNTIIVINADQGLLLGEHGLWKKRCFYEQNVCVPFIMSCPELLPRKKVIEEPVEMVDFLPTLMDLCGFPVPTAIQGRSLMPLVRADIKQWKPACFCEHDYSRDMYAELRDGGRLCVMVRTKRYKLVSFVGANLNEENSSLYDLINDPQETKNLFKEPGSTDIVQNLRDLASKHGFGNKH